MDKNIKDLKYEIVYCKGVIDFSLTNDKQKIEDLKIHLDKIDELYKQIFKQNKTFDICVNLSIKNLES